MSSNIRIFCYNICLNDMRYITYLCISLFIICGCGIKPEKTVCFKNVRVRAEVAQTASARKTGLMLRQQLAAKEGMLFVFPKEEQQGIWMKNMLFPLDIIWISEDKKVVYIAASALPCMQTCNAIAPNVKAKYVLEVNAGFTDRYSVRTGEKVRF